MKKGFTRTSPKNYMLVLSNDGARYAFCMVPGAQGSVIYAHDEKIEVFVIKNYAWNVYNSLTGLCIGSGKTKIDALKNTTKRIIKHTKKEYSTVQSIQIENYGYSPSFKEELLED